MAPASARARRRRHAERLLKLIDALEDNDDVQTVAANFEIADDVLARLTA